VNLLDSAAYLSEFLMLLAVQRALNATRIKNSGESDKEPEAKVFNLLAFAGFAAFMILLLLLVVDSALFEGEYWRAFEDSKLVSILSESLRIGLKSLAEFVRARCCCRAPHTASAAHKKEHQAKGRAGLAASGSVAAKEQQKAYFTVDNPMQRAVLAEASRRAGAIRSQDSAADFKKSAANDAASKDDALARARDDLARARADNERIKELEAQQEKDLSLIHISEPTRLM
jgi:hypothetical protein